MSFEQMIPIDNSILACCQTKHDLLFEQMTSQFADTYICHKAQLK